MEREKVNIKQVWVPWWEWEDYKFGMWRTLEGREEKEMIARVYTLMGNTELFAHYMGEVVERWPRTMINSLTNLSVNQIAFVGQCGCCYGISCPEYITRMVWKSLTNVQRENADKAAGQIIKNWKLVYVSANN